VETAEVANVSLPGGTSTVTVNETANSPLEPTITPLSEALPRSSGTVYLPFIANKGEQPAATAAAPIAAASTTTPSPSATKTPRTPETPSPTETNSPPTDTPSPAAYQLLIATNGEDSLFVVSLSEEAFPLGPLRLGSGNEAIQGTEWNLGQLAPGDCVTAWKNGGNPRPPDVDCSQVGVQVIRQGPDRFWKNQFDVFYDGKQVGVCNPQNQCVIEIAE
jgi:hypothetical protein